MINVNLIQFIQKLRFMEREDDVYEGVDEVMLHYIVLL